MQQDVQAGKQRSKRIEDSVTRNMQFQSKLCIDLQQPKGKGNKKNQFPKKSEKITDTTKSDVEAHQQTLVKILEDYEELKKVERELQEKCNIIKQQLEVLRPNLPQLLHYVPMDQQRGLTPARIEKFQQFQADESLVGDCCGVCLDDIEIGRRMVRLDCNGRHIFCKDCVEGWFVNQNTCPNCRHIFT